MNIVDAYTILYTAMEDADRVFEFWMSGTFAVIVAVFVGSNHLNFIVRSIITFIYLIFAITTTARLMVASSKIIEFREILIQQGEAFVPLPSTTVGVTLPLLVVSGILATMYFVWRTDKR